MLTIEIIGNIGADASYKDINGQRYISFNLAHTDSYKTATGEKKETTVWVSCLKKGESSVIQYLKKGSMIYVRGTMSVNIYDYKGTKQIGINANVTELRLLSSKTSPGNEIGPTTEKSPF